MIMDILNWIGVHWVIGTFLAWMLIWGVSWVIIVALEVFLKVSNRILRSINIALRGWPPEHVDADGDFV